jgi:GT2 family glycosyltransferase
VPVVHVHGDTLHGARNDAVDVAPTEWVCHLDADDELEAGYFDAMSAGTADLRAPLVRYVRNMRRMPDPRRVPVAGHDHDCVAACLAEGNFMVIGTLVRKAMVQAVGGWRDFSWSEDWDMWLRCWQAGATVETVEGAVYRAWVRYDSRNRGASAAEKLRAHHDIARANGLS